MKSLLANWKTTSAGLASVALGGLALAGVTVAGSAPMDPAAALTMIVAGVGLIFAKDGNVTGGSKPQ